MNTIHFVTGGVGQGGKSLFCKTLIEFYLKHEIPFKLFDCDRTHPDVGLSYDRENYTGDKIGEQAYFTEDKCGYGDTDRILEGIGDILVNLPSQSSVAVNKYLNLINPGWDGIDKDFDIVFWFVSKPSPLAIQLLTSEFNFYGGKVRHVLVKNLMEGFGYGRWEDIIDRRTKEFLETSKIAEIEMPHLSMDKDTFKSIEHDYSILSELIEEEDKRLSRSWKIHTRKFLAEMMISIEVLNIIDIQKGKSKLPQS